MLFIYLNTVFFSIVTVAAMNTFNKCNKTVSNLNFYISALKKVLK